MLLSLTCQAQTATPTRVEIIPTPAGADLITFYRNGMPQVSILRDTLSDDRPEAHRLRQVWDFSYARPTFRQRLAAAIPFFYHRAGRNPASDRVAPEAVFDLSDPLKGTWGRIAETIAQWDVLNSEGVFVRAPTLSYRGNSLDYRNMHLVRALEVVESGTSTPVLPAILSDEDWDEVRGRLLLGERLLGGFVSAERAEKVSADEVVHSEEDRASNLDLLRQSAERNGLYIEPMDYDRGIPREAVLWFDSSAGAPSPAGKFAGAFLGISDPWHDARLKKWRGYSQTWFLDNEGIRVESAAPGINAARMIPLAFYSLDYPRVPLLLIDFRSDRAKRREVTRRAAGDVTTGIFGITPYASLSWFTVRTTYQFVRDRQGAALNRSERLAAYARARQMLLETATDETVPAAFHKLLESKLDGIALSPFEQGSTGEALLARRQYAALMRWAQDPNGLAKALDRARAQEYFVETHGPGERALARSLQVATFGLWSPYHKPTMDTLDELDRNRRETASLRADRKDLPPVSAPPASPQPPSESVSGAGQ
jgi:hypothetical protein